MRDGTDLEKPGSTISCLWPLYADHAVVPVMWPRTLPIATCAATDTMLPNVQPNQPVDERGGVHGVPDLDHLEELCRTSSMSLRIPAMKEKKR